jgi:hypothetical protein
MKTEQAGVPKPPHITLPAVASLRHESRHGRAWVTLDVDVAAFIKCK